MPLLLIVIYIVFISLGLPDSLFGVSWPVLHLDFGVPESFAAIYSIIIGVCTGGVSFVAGKLIRRFGTMNEGVSFAILLMNLVVPYIDVLTRQDKLGIAKVKKGGAAK